eukprot:6243038-Amphidinium_carterae.1
MPAVKRSAPFPVAFVKHLDEIVFSETVCEENAYLAGLVQFLLYSRSRFADAQRIETEPVIEFGNLVTRTAR